MSAGSRGPEGEWRRPPARGADAAPQVEGAGRSGLGRRRLLSAFRGRSALSPPPCDLAPCPSCGRLLRGPPARALPPLFCLDLGEEGQCLPGRAPPLRPSAPAPARAAAPGLATVSRMLLGREACRPPRPPLTPFPQRSSEPVRKMPAAVTGCGGPAPRVLRPRRRRHYGAPSGECAEARSALRCLSRGQGGHRHVLAERSPRLSPLRASAVGFRCPERPCPLRPILSQLSRVRHRGPIALPLAASPLCLGCSCSRPSAFRGRAVCCRLPCYGGLALPFSPLPHLELGAPPP